MDSVDTATSPEAEAFLLEREKLHQAKSEGIDYNTNKQGTDKQKNLAGDYAKMMAAMHAKGGKKQLNRKDQKRVNYKLNQQKQQAYERAMQAKAEEDRLREEKEWAPQDKEDQKFQKKMAKKVEQMNDNGPTKAEQRRALELEDDEINGVKHKVKKNGWGKVKGNA